MNDTLSVQSTVTLAQSYLKTAVARALLRNKEPAKLSDILDACSQPAIDADILRYTLWDNRNLFISTERRWTLAARFEDASQPLLSIVQRVLRQVGQPVPIDQLAHLLAGVHRRSPHATAVLLYRLGNAHLCVLPGYRVGLREWLLNTDYNSPEDVAFYNFVNFSEAQRLLDDYPNFDGSPEAVIHLLNIVASPLSARFVAYLQWRVNPENFDAMQAYQNILDTDGIVALPLQEPGALEPGTHWALAQWVPQWIDALRPVAATLSAQLAAQMAEPLVLSVGDVENMVQYVLKAQQVVTTEALARHFFDLTPGEPTYADDLETITQSLVQDERILWLGGMRFVNKVILPAYLLQTPESLLFHEVQHYTDQGEPLEIELEDEGLSGTLRSDILDPVAQDTDDEEEPVSILPIPDSVRCVVKARHKEIGTFPLCQIPLGFLPLEPSFQKVTFVDENSGEVYSDVYINHDTRLIYGLHDWYSTREVVSGLVFTLTRTEDPFVYKVRWEESLDQRVHLSRTRYEELLDMSTRLASLPTFDIVCEILSTHRGGMEFLSVLSEVNVIRRTRRRRVASVLSAFQAFYLRGGLWHLDERKRDAGIDRAKRKHIRK